MEAFLVYIGKSALAAGAFYLVYLALFQNQKQFTFNRIYLPVSLALSFIIPLITFTTVNYVEPVTVEANPFPVLTESPEPVVMQQSRSQIIWEWYHYLFAIYAAGTTLFLFRLLLGHGKAWNIIRKSRVQELFSRLVNISKNDIHPFSFFNKIVLSENTLSHPNLNIIVAHENIHVKEKHTLDILFTEILFLLQWFNPFAWLLKDAVKNNLEYKTDDQIAKTTVVQTYQFAMVALVEKQGVAPFLTALNGSQLKSRIIMMKKRTENRYAWLKQLVVLPLLAVMIMGLAEREVKTEFIKHQKQIENQRETISSAENSEKYYLDPSETVYNAVEVMPEFPGGEFALRMYLAKSIRYPVKAQQAGIQGKVYVSFVINKDGNVANAMVMRGVEDSLDEEALRVIHSLPAWKPGKHEGKAVSVSYTVPISFLLQD